MEKCDWRCWDEPACVAFPRRPRGRRRRRKQSASLKFSSNPTVIVSTARAKAGAPPPEATCRAVAVANVRKAIMTLLLALALALSVGLTAAPQAAPQTTSHLLSAGEHQLLAQAGGVARLPCLIGPQYKCGEPYFIAWYKQNALSRQWTRIEARSASDQPPEASEELAAAAPGVPLAQSRPLTERVRFSWQRSGGARLTGASCPLGADANASAGSDLAAAFGNRPLAAAPPLFDCAQLTVSALELQDEGRYKCEITFSDALDFDKCPTSTTTQLSVIARPNEPEILLNGRPAAAAAGSGAQLTFKEGAQVRLECQSAGGKPAPRIEWLNLTSWRSSPLQADANAAQAANQRHEPASTGRDNNDDQSIAWAGGQAGDERPPELVQLMRLYWPIKRATYQAAQDGQPQPGNNVNQAGGGGAQSPITSSSITITLSRFDLRSRFVCLVLPSSAAPGAGSQQAAGRAPLAGELPASVSSAASLGQLLERVPMLASARLNADEAAGLAAPMLKWIKLDVLAKPTSVSIRVFELDAGRAPLLLAPVAGGGAPDVPPSSLVLSGQGQTPAQGIRQQQQQPFYSLHPNRLHAIQCLVENSRPRSQVAWFNRTSPVELEGGAGGGAPVELTSSDYLLPQWAHAHRLSSFVRHSEQASGTFRTVSTLLLTTNFNDNFEELFCRVSNEAFQFDELIQVAPIISARIYVNYPPSGWLEARNIRWQSAPTTAPAPPRTGRLEAEAGQRLQLRCFVGASPLQRNALVQIEWLKDGLPLSNADNRFQVERANHLHLPLVSQQQQHQIDLSNQIAASSSPSEQAPPPTSVGPQPAAGRLLTYSSLTVSSPTKADAGAYSCQFRLVSEPRLQQVAAGGVGVGVGGEQRTVSGRAHESVLVRVVEAKLPVIQAASANGLLVYDKTTAAHQIKVRPAAGAAEHRLRQGLEVAVADLSAAELSFKCAFEPEARESAAAAAAAGTSAARKQPLPAGLEGQLGRKVLWYLNGAFWHSSAADLLVLRPGQAAAEAEAAGLLQRLASGNGGRLSCAHQMFEPDSGLAAPGGFHAQAVRLYKSANELDLRFKIEPKLLLVDAIHRPENVFMPARRAISELELLARPMSRLKFVCLAQCEPLCAIDWLINKRPIAGRLAPAKPAESEEASEPARLQLHEVADNQTRIFKGAKRVEARPVGDWPAAQPALEFVELDNLIRRRATSSAQRFSWYKQTSFGPDLSVASDANAASRQLMRDSFELLQTLPGEAAQASNVFSKLELDYAQVAKLLEADGEPQGKTAAAGEVALIECRLNEFLDGRRHQGARDEASGEFGHARIEPNAFFPTRTASPPPADDLLADGERAQWPFQQAASRANEDGAALNYAPLNLTSVLVGNGPANAPGEQVGTAQHWARLQASQIVFEGPRARVSVAPSSDGPAINFAFGMGNGPEHAIQQQQHSQAQPPANNTSAKFASSSTAANEVQIAPRAASSPTTTHIKLGPSAHDWLKANLNLLLAGGFALSLVWLLALFAAPLMRRHCLRSSSRLRRHNKTTAAAAMLAASGGRQLSGWRLDRHSGSNSGSCSRSPSEHAAASGGPFAPYALPPAVGHKFAPAAPNYYGAATDSNNGTDLSEPDNVGQSCHSQSSHYEDFVQHQLKQRLLSQQQLYFNHPGLGGAGNATISRKPPPGGRHSAAQQRAQAATLLRPSGAGATRSVPLIGGFTHTSSRINLNQPHRTAATLHQQDRLALHQQTFGRQPQIPEHIYDDVT